jgi:hypothetical protein
MTPVELLAILVLAGAIVVLLYYYMLDTRNASLVKARTLITDTSEKARSSVSGSTKTGEGDNRGRFGDKMSDMSGKARSAVTGASDKVTIEGSMIDGVSERMAGMSEKIKGTVKGVPKSTDTLSNRIDLFLNDKSGQLIKDWELATKNDVVDLEKRYGKVSRDLDELDSRFNEYRGYTNKKVKKIEERLGKLESPEDGD